MTGWGAGCAGKGSEAFCQTEVDCVLFRLFALCGRAREEYSMPHFNMMNGEEAFGRARPGALRLLRCAQHYAHPYDES